MNFSYITKGAYPPVAYGVQDPEHNRALGHVVRLLRRNLEYEAWDVVYKWLYNHKDMGKPKPEKEKEKTEGTRKPRKPRKTNPAPDTSAYPTVQSFAFDFFALLFALRQYFQSLNRNTTKLRVGELCKRLYGYSIHLVGGLSDEDRLSEEDVRSLAESLGVGVNEILADGKLLAFYTWLGALDDVQWWERERYL